MANDEAPKDLQVAAQELFQHARDALAEMGTQIADARKFLNEYVTKHGFDPANKEDVEKVKQIYQSSLKVTVVDDPRVPGANALMDKMYGLYTETFPIAEEREELSKLKELLSKNHDPKLQAAGAPFKEQWVMVQDDKGDVVAATNIITFSASNDPKVAKDVDGTTHLTYIFVDPRYRSLGLGDFALKNAETEARKVVAATYSPARDPDTIDLIQVAEQNAPLELSMSASLTDTAGAKIDQFYRRKYFESLGFRELGYQYTQLPLGPRDKGGEPGEGMNLIIRGLPAPQSTRHIPQVMTKVSSGDMRFHLYNFFDRSVAAGQYEVEADPDWIKQAATLHGNLKVRPQLDFMPLQKKAWDCMEKYINSPGFDADDFENKELGALMHIRKVPALTIVPRTTLSAKTPRIAVNVNGVKGQFDAATTRQITPPASSATKSAPSLAVATPTGRP